MEKTGELFRALLQDDVKGFSEDWKARVECCVVFPMEITLRVITFRYNDLNNTLLICS
jgi:hypothetical protein